MCGIVLTIGENAEQKTRNALNRLKHRGSDDLYVININSNVSIGFTRLAINDTTVKGRQPFVFKDLYGAFNGEIYNYKSLREKYDIKCYSKTDTEIILPLFSEYNDEIYTLLTGMFAGVIFDSKNQNIITIKDIVSRKPLFVVKTYKHIYFTSELKSITDNVKSFQNINSGVCRFDLKGNRTSCKYENIKTQKIKPFSSDINILYSLLSKSVKKRIPNEKIGIFLSGGLDSSIISYIALKYTKDIIFYSLVSENNPDFKNVIELVEYLNIKNIRYIKLPENKDVMSLIKKVVYYSESYNPSIISNGIGTYLLSKEAKKDGIKVVLSGEGADEVFCGYKSFIKNGLVVDDWKNLRTQLIENLYFTELRRVDLCSMAHTIESRSPFLDEDLLMFANSLESTGFFNDNNGKYILKQAFKNKLPDKIINRKKVSFDVGSGLRGLVVNNLRISNKSEKENLEKIWDSLFKNYSNQKNEEYFHSYPIFNKAIDIRHG